MIKTSEANLIEKTNATTQREIEKASSNIVNIAKNEILINKAEITKLYEDSGKRVEEVASAIKQIGELLPKLDVRVKELEVFKYSKQGKMGAIIGQIELLEYDLTNRVWYLPFRLPEILKEVKNTRLPLDQADKLKELLNRIKEKEYEKIITDILNAIVVEQDEEPKK